MLYYGTATVTSIIRHHVTFSSCHVTHVTQSHTVVFLSYSYMKSQILLFSFFLSDSLCLCVCVCLPVCWFLCICLYLCLSICLSVWICLSVSLLFLCLCLSVSLYVCLFVCLSVCLFLCVFLSLSLSISLLYYFSLLDVAKVGAAVLLLPIQKNTFSCSVCQGQPVGFVVQSISSSLFSPNTRSNIRPLCDYCAGQGYNMVTHHYFLQKPWTTGRLIVQIDHCGWSLNSDNNNKSHDR